MEEMKRRVTYKNIPTVVHFKRSSTPPHFTEQKILGINLKFSLFCTHHLQLFHDEKGKY
jgi:hypothetical protein